MYVPVSAEIDGTARRSMGFPAVQENPKVPDAALIRFVPVGGF
jgi:hypothetical protein